MRDYYYSYLFGNDTINKVASTEIFKLMINSFDGKAKTTIGQIDNTTLYLKKLKYWYGSIKGDLITLLIKSL